MKPDRMRVLALLFAVALAYHAAHGQVMTGTPPFGSFGGGSFDTINLGNLNVHFSIPVLIKAGRGLPFYYVLSYDSSIWSPVTSNGVTTWVPASNWGWRAQTDAATGWVSNTAISVSCKENGNVIGGQTTTYTNWIYYDKNGTSHPFLGNTKVVVNFGGTNNTCPPAQTTSLTATATDDSGFTLVATGGSGHVLAATGSQFNPLPINTPTGTGTVTDRNGNQLSVSSSGVYTDTLATTALTIAGTTNIGSSSTATTYTYTGEAGAEKVTMTYKAYTVRAQFGCSGINAFGPQTKYLVDRITLPDASFYSFTYELDADQTDFPGDVTGRIASVTLPTGGTIKYTYTGGTNGIFCTDGSTAGFAHNTPDGTSHYSRTAANTSHVGTTTVTDAANNVSTYTFYEPTNNPPYEVQRQVNTSSSTLLETVTTCYNNQAPASSCVSSPASFTNVTQITRYTDLPNSTGIESEVNELYNSIGLLTERDEYDFGTPGSALPLIRKRSLNYGNYNAGSCTALGNNIQDRPCYDIMYDSAGHRQAETIYNYDQTAVVASGATQHVSVSGSRGNLTTLGHWTGGQVLNTVTTFFDTGLPQTVTDVNGDQTTYTYGACDDAFPTSISEPAGLSRSMTWNCAGAVALTSKDEAGATTTIHYGVVNSTDTNQVFWRPSSVVDGMGNSTAFTYAAGGTRVESVMNFGSSTVDNVVTYDSLGRTHVTQRRQAPGSSTFDSAETDYNSNGQMSKVTMPYAGAIGATSSTAPYTAYTNYDGLGRVGTITDGGGGVTSFTYSKNISTRSITPAPTGETSKSWAFQYDGLGRLINVCEGSGGDSSWGTCGFNGWFGHWSKYTYDILDDITGVTLNAQAPTPQTRSFAYDALTRLTSETNPESGTTTYTYDSVSDVACVVTNNGDLVEKKDARGDKPCYVHGSFHRLISVGSQGPDASITPDRCYAYDSAVTVSGTTTTYVSGRLGEAYTTAHGTGCSASKTTDEIFSYDADGHTTDLWESTPNSGGLYHVTDQYFPNGVVNTLVAKLANGSFVGGLPTITYGVDGEGRPTTVSASSAPNPVTAAMYNVFSELTGVTLGSGDSDTYSYDPNTGRMTQYQFTINSSNKVTGALTWNPNGTLQKLAITDPFNASDAQTCTYQYDPIARLSQANCGTIWGQNFTYDAYGNLTKNVITGDGGVAWNPMYDNNNHYTLTGTGYDKYGNLTADTFHSYTWDAFGNVATIDSTTVTHDTFGRIVEFKGTTTRQFLYTPSGINLAKMNGQTLDTARVPLPGGNIADYHASGFNAYGHADWLGTTRFGSTSSRAKDGDWAVAPFGETYAGGTSSYSDMTGKFDDIGSLLWDFPMREYHSTQWLWISHDPAGLGGGGPNESADVEPVCVCQWKSAGERGPGWAGYAPRL